MPEGLEQVLDYFKQKYDNPLLFIYENGILYSLFPFSGSRYDRDYYSPTARTFSTGQRSQRNVTLLDQDRTDYIHAYIGAVLKSIR